MKLYDMTCFSCASFSWVANVPFEGSRMSDGGTFPGTSIEMLFSRRDPFAKLPQERSDLLVVAMYAWDGNAFPGTLTKSQKNIC